MALSDQDQLIYAQIQHLRKMKKEIQLTIQSLLSLLPDRNPTEKAVVYLIHPKTGKKVAVKCGR